MNTGENEKDALKAKVESILGRKIVSSIWKLVPEDSKELARKDAAYAMDHLLDEVRRLLKAQAEGAVRRPKPPRPAYEAPRLPSRERLRSEILTAEYAARARTFDRVGEFRASYLERLLVTPEDVSRFLRSEVYRLLSGDEMKSRGLPTAGVSSWKMTTQTRVLRLEDGTHLAVTTHYLDCAWQPDGKATVTVPVPVLPSTNEPPWMDFDEPVPGLGWRITFKYLRGSALDALVGIAETLAWRFGWKKSSALLFVLTDVPPPSPAIHTDVEQRQGIPATRGEIILHIQPWTSADVVRHVYQHARRWMIGRRSRPISESSLKLFSKVSEARRRAPVPKWPEIARELGFGRRWRTVRQVFLRTERQLLVRHFAMGATLRPRKAPRILQAKSQEEEEDF